MKRELPRQLVHLLLGLFFIALVLVFGQQQALAFSGIVLLAGLIVSLAIAHEREIPLLNKIVKHVERNHEKHLPGKGALVFAFAVVCSMILFALQPQKVIVGALIVLAFGDFASTVFGKKFGKHKVLGNRTAEGTIAGIIVSFAALLSILNPLTAIATAFFGMLAEFLPINDNYSIPIVSGLVLMLLV